MRDLDQRPAPGAPGAAPAPAVGLAIVADDFTGAADTAAGFAAAGLPAAVWSADPAAAPVAPVVAVATHSRHLPPAEAAAAVARAAAALAARGARRWFKKVDSTLRGNLGAELDALAGDRLAVVCPAVPAQGRAVRDGVLWVAGRPVAETEFARDPRHPVRSSRIAQVLAQQSPLPVAEVPLATVRAGAAALAAALRALPAPRAVVDAETDADLDAVAAACLAVGALPCGAAGLGAAVARYLAAAAAFAPPPASSPVPGAPAPVLAVVGSAHPLAREQAARLAAHLGCQPIPVPPVPGTAPLPVGQPGASPPGAVTLGAIPPGTTVRGAVLVAPASPADPHGVEQALAEAAASLARCLRPAALLVVGGETARATLAALGAGGLALAGEAVPGVPWGRLLGGPLAGLPAATKAGGFGHPDTLVHVVQRLLGTGAAAGAPHGTPQEGSH